MFLTSNSLQNTFIALCNVCLNFSRSFFLTFLQKSGVGVQLYAI